MKRNNTQSIGEILRDFFEDNTDSAVLRSELLLSKEHLKASLNKEIGSAYLFDVVIR